MRVVQSEAVTLSRSESTDASRSASCAPGGAVVSRGSRVEAAPRPRHLSFTSLLSPVRLWCMSCTAGFDWRFGLVREAPPPYALPRHRHLSSRSNDHLVRVSCVSIIAVSSSVVPRGGHARAPYDAPHARPPARHPLSSRARVRAYLMHVVRREEHERAARSDLVEELPQRDLRERESSHPSSSSSIARVTQPPETTTTTARHDYSPSLSL